MGVEPLTTPGLDRFSAPVLDWFTAAFGEPTEAQRRGWPAIARGENTLILAPTGSGKTLAAFLWGLDRLMCSPAPEDRGRRTRLLYISPLRALAVDVEKNLRAPLAGIARTADRLGMELHSPEIGLRTGDTPAAERRRLVRHPPDLLITTPESLYLMLTSAARETLRGVEAVIVDEIHALAATKRGAHLALTLERLVSIADGPIQRIGLSATQRPLDEMARFLGGHEPASEPDSDPVPRAVTVVDAGIRRPLDIEVVVPVEEMGRSAVEGSGGSIWPSIHPKLLELVEQHRSTIIFVNSRRLAERLATRLNELAAEGENRAAEAEGRPPAPGDELVMAHHGSLSRERRLHVEDELKQGRLRAIVATSSLELGIDMGAVDLVVQVGSPGAVSTGVQRVGRAGHRVGEPSRAKLFPRHRNELVEAAVVVERMHDGLIESTHYLRNPLDVLAQQVVAMCALDDWSVSELASVIRRAAPFAGLSDALLDRVLDVLAGRYPSEEFAELRPRIVWDRANDVVSGRSGTQRLAVTSGGTIPDRGLFGVFLPGGSRVGELDEEMVYESRPGERFLLGASTWRIEQITTDRVVVTPAPGEPGKMPFWHGDGPGRSYELGKALGAFIREIRDLAEHEALGVLSGSHCLDEVAARNLVGYLTEQADACGGVIPDDRTIVVERFRDELGDWRVCILTPFGSRLHAPWAVALRARLAELRGVDVETMWSDDGIVVRLPEGSDVLSVEELSIDPRDIDGIVVAQLPGTPMFASRFRECAARALLLPRRRPDRRTPLWQQRQRAADLLAVASGHPDFPVLLEATRECLEDVFDMPALREVLHMVQTREIRIAPVDTRRASPFARSLSFGWIANHMYEGDAPLAERRASALALDRDLLRDLLGGEELRELLDSVVLADLEAELQHLVDGRRARDDDELHDLLRMLGPLSRPEMAQRCTGAPQDVATWVARLLDEGRAIVVTVAGEDRLAASEDASRLHGALGVALPVGLPAVFAEPVAAPLEDLVSRFARTHGPFLADEVAHRYGVAPDRVTDCLERLEASGRVTRGEFRPDGVEREWCDESVLRRLRNRSLALLRKEVEPVDATAFARFIALWQGVGEPRHGLDGLVEVVGSLQGLAVPASVLEADLMSARMATYRPSDLDALCGAGELVWIGAGALGDRDGRVRLFFRDQARLLVTPGGSHDGATGSGLHVAIREHLRERGASFWPEIVAAAHAAGLRYDDDSVLDALWDLVWAAEVTNDVFAPVRARVTGGSRSTGRGRPGGRVPLGSLARTGPPAAAGRWSLVASLLEPSPDPVEIEHARALQLVERYGVLTREAVAAEGTEGGFAGLYRALGLLEERGRVRRGYFVVGQGASQFALPGAVDRLRSCREHGVEDPTPSVLAATDPAQPYGSVLAWPDSAGRPARAAGAYVVLVGGEPVAHLERGGRSITTFAASAHHPQWADALAGLVKDGRFAKLEIVRIDGGPASASPVAEQLRRAGFVDGYRGLVSRS